MRSGRRRSASATADSPSTASPTTRMWGARDSARRRPSRTTSWSSAIRQLMAVATGFMMLFGRVRGAEEALAWGARGSSSRGLSRHFASRTLRTSCKSYRPSEQRGRGCGRSLPVHGEPAWVRRLPALAVLLAAVVALATGLTVPAHAAPSAAEKKQRVDERLREARERLERTRAAERAVQAAIGADTDEIRRLALRLGRLNGRLDELQERLAPARRRLAELRKVREEANVRLEALEASQLRVREVATERLVAMYRNGELDPVAVMLSGDSIAGSFQALRELQRIADADRQLFADLADAERNVTAERAQAQAASRALRAAAADLFDEEAEVERQTEQAAGVYQRLESRRAERRGRLGEALRRPAGGAGGDEAPGAGERRAHPQDPPGHARGGRRPHPALHRRAALAVQRRHHVELRLPLGPHARGPGHRLLVRGDHRGRGPGDDHLRRAAGRLRQPHPDPALAVAGHGVRAPVLVHPHVGPRRGGHADRPRRLHGPLDRPAPALRDARQRRRRRIRCASCNLRLD